MKNNKLRQNGLKIMANLVLLLGNFAYFLIFAVINGVLGFICAMGVTIFGSIGIAKYLGENISLSYELIISLTIICGVLRGLLRYIEQYSNHYIAFKLLAILRDKIFSALRILAPAKLEGKQKGGIIAMVTSDIETLEVFYAHTLSPIMICIFVSLGIIIYVGLVSSWYLSLCAIISYLIIGILLPLISSSKMKNIGVNYRQEFSSFNAYYMDSIKGVKEIVLHNGMDRRTSQVNKRSDSLLKETKKT